MDGRRSPRSLANELVIEHKCEPDRDAMLAALRVVLGLPGRPTLGGGREDAR